MGSAARRAAALPPATIAERERFVLIAQQAFRVRSWTAEEWHRAKMYPSLVEIHRTFGSWRRFVQAVVPKEQRVGPPLRISKKAAWAAVWRAYMEYGKINPPRWIQMGLYPPLDAVEAAIGYLPSWMNFFRRRVQLRRFPAEMLSHEWTRKELLLALIRWMLKTPKSHWTFAQWQRDLPAESPLRAEAYVRMFRGWRRALDEARTLYPYYENLWMIIQHPGFRRFPWRTRQLFWMRLAGYTDVEIIATLHYAKHGIVKSMRLAMWQLGFSEVPRVTQPSVGRPLPGWIAEMLRRYQRASRTDSVEWEGMRPLLVQTGGGAIMEQTEGGE